MFRVTFAEHFKTFDGLDRPRTVIIYNLRFEIYDLPLHCWSYILQTMDKLQIKRLHDVISVS